MYFVDWSSNNRVPIAPAGDAAIRTDGMKRNVLYGEISKEDALFPVIGFDTVKRFDKPANPGAYPHATIPSNGFGDSVSL
jgi:hypothetical protein